MCTNPDQHDCSPTCMLATQEVLTLGGSSAAQLADLAPARIGELWRQYMTAFAGEQTCRATPRPTTAVVCPA